MKEGDFVKLIFGDIGIITEIKTFLWIKEHCVEIITPSNLSEYIIGEEVVGLEHELTSVFKQLKENVHTTT